MGEQPEDVSDLNAAAATALPKDAGGAIDYARPGTVTASAESFGRRSARGAIVMMAMNGGSSIISFVANMVLAHFLLPDLWGITAPVISIAGVVAVLRDAGAPAILIQRHDEFDRIAGSIFWLNIAAAMLCALIVALAAPIVAHYKGQPILIWLMLLTALRFPVGALGTVSNVKLAIDLRWTASALASFVQPVVTAIVAITMAWRGFGVYSLIIPGIFADGARGLASWLLARVHVPIWPRWEVISAILGSSVYIVLTNLTLAVRGFGDYLTLSFITHDDNQTGLYLFAFTMAQAASRLTVGALPLVLAPVFSKVKQEKARHADIMTTSIHLFAALGVLPLVMQAVLAWPMFRLVLRAKWGPAAPLFSIITLQVIAVFLNVVIFQAMWANGKYREFFRYSAIFTPGMVILFVIGTFLAGATGVAWANVVAGIVDIAIFPIYAFRVLHIPWKPVMAPLWKPLVAAVPTVIAALVVFRMLPISRGGDIGRVLIVGSIGTLCYFAILMLIWPQTLRAVFGHAFGALGLARK